jgi:3-oxoacyl-[acyl-carrier protein] reductase
MLDGQVSVVTGAGRGIGRAIALGLARSGAAVVCSARTRSEIDAVVDEIVAAGGQASAIQCDITQAADVQGLYDFTAQQFGGLDIVFGNAGAQPEHIPLAESDPAQWTGIVNTNLIGAYLTARYAVPYLRRRGGGKIVLIGSGSGHTGFPNISAYACAKAGLRMLVRVLAQETARDGIAVNELIPGVVATDMLHNGAETEAYAQLTAVEWVKTAEDVVPLALFLASLPSTGPSAQTYSLTRREI